jgi:hypothetical protein
MGVAITMSCHEGVRCATSRQIGGMLIATTLVVFVSVAKASEPVANLHFTLGGNYYAGYHTNKDRETGVIAIVGMSNWPVLLSAYYVTSSGYGDSDIEVDFNYTSDQLGLGITRVWSWGRVQPYTGGGWARTRYETDPIDSTWPDQEEVEDGAWLGAGVTYRLGFLSAGLGGRVKVDITEYDDKPTWSAAGLLGIALPAP